MPFLYLLLSNKRWTAIVIMAFILICQLIQANSLNNKLNQCKQQNHIITALHTKSNADLKQVSEDYEIEKSKKKVVINERKEKVKTITKTNTVYSSCKLDDSVRQELHNATIAE